MIHQTENSRKRRQMEKGLEMLRKRKEVAKQGTGYSRMRISA